VAEHDPKVAEHDPKVAEHDPKVAGILKKLNLSED